MSWFYRVLFIGSLVIILFYLAKGMLDVFI